MKSVILKVWENCRCAITVDESECLLVMSLLYRRTIGTIAGNIIAAILAVQLTVNKEINNVLYVVVKLIISGCREVKIQAAPAVERSEMIIIFCRLFIGNQCVIIRCQINFAIPYNLQYHQVQLVLWAIFRI